VKNVMLKLAQMAFIAFGLVVFALMLSFSFSALGRVYPNNLPNQLMGLALFDLGAVVWMLVFIYKAKGSWQRAGAFALFLADFSGSLGLVAIEVLLGGQSYVKVADWVGQALVYIFIAAIALNLIGVYFQHFTEPAVQSEIENQSMADEIEEEARRQAGESNKLNLRDLGKQLAHRMQNDVRVRLSLPALADDLFGVPVQVTAASTIAVPASQSVPTTPQNPTK
jgi:hypothetical protein